MGTLRSFFFQVFGRSQSLISITPSYFILLPRKCLVLHLYFVTHACMYRSRGLPTLPLFLLLVLIGR
uniref:Uncharacterized protein n=1 Tax=Lepeophtheirus salmonis TaxID=72036 RepID=A0A0K2T3A6_LEPSM